MRAAVIPIIYGCGEPGELCFEYYVVFFVGITLSVRQLNSQLIPSVRPSDSQSVSHTVKQSFTGNLS